MQGPMQAATLDDVMARLDALERNNAKLAKENAQLRDRVNHITSHPVPPATAAATPKGNPVQHAAVAPSPTPPAPEHAVVSIGGAPLYTKATGTNAFVDNTTVTLYGHVDLSGDFFNAGVFDQATSSALRATSLTSAFAPGTISSRTASQDGPPWPSSNRWSRSPQRRPSAPRSAPATASSAWKRVGRHQGRQGRYAVQEIDREVRSVLGHAC